MLSCDIHSSQNRDPLAFSAQVIAKNLRCISETGDNADDTVETNTETMTAICAEMTSFQLLALTTCAYVVSPDSHGTKDLKALTACHVLTKLNFQ